MENTTLNAVYSFIRNPDYWNPDAFPYDRLEITLLPDLTARLNALKSGQIDLADVDSATAADAESAGFDIQEYAVATVILNLGDRRGELLPAIGDVRVRRAIAEAIDRESIATTLENGFASPVNQAYSEMDPGFQADRVDENPFDPEQARELLAEAGYPDGFDLSIPSYGPVTGKYEAYVQQALADIGIRVTYLPMTDDNWLTEFMSGTYPVILHGELLSQIDDMADPGYWWNPWHNESPQTDELLSILNSGTEDEALAAYRELGAIMLDEVWFAPLTQPLTLVATSSAIEVPATAWAGSISLKDIHPAS
jgi:peptide/nickel transport system substrate-binding protein